MRGRYQGEIAPKPSGRKTVRSLAVRKDRSESRAHESGVRAWYAAAYHQNK
jgi:hypothetical protein